ncbi:MAG TPA: 50S ribosomal protein L21 [Burkholderiaceae bacterium]|nr:50S ribosomal protein L21 [Burkholderiaceae bacterium]
MFAVIQTGGKQYRVSAGDKLKVESLPAHVGEQISLGSVLATTDGANVRLGAEAASATVKATVLAHGRHDKVRIFKMRRRKHSMKRTGHRQNYTEVQIDSISA